MYRNLVKFGHCFGDIIVYYVNMAAQNDTARHAVAIFERAVKQTDRQTDTDTYRYAHRNTSPI